MSVQIRLTESQVDQWKPLLATQGLEHDRANFFVVESSYDHKTSDSVVSAELCAVSWQASKKIIKLLRKEQIEMSSDLNSLVSKGRIERARKGVIYGVEGIGKTTLASQLPGALIIDTERGSDDMENITRVSITAIDQWENVVVSLLRKTGAGFQTIVIDTIDWFEKLLTLKVCAKGGQESIEGFGYGKGYTLLREEFDKQLFRLDEFITHGVNVVFIAHSQVKKVTPPETSDGYDRYCLKLDKVNADKVKEWADFVLFVNWVTTVKENAVGKTTASGGKERKIYTVHTAAYDAKNRAGLADKLPFDIASLAPLFPARTVKASTEAEKPAPANVASVSAATSEPSPDGTGPQPVAASLLQRFEAIADTISPKIVLMFLQRPGGRLKEGQTFADLPDDYLEKVVENAANFSSAVQVYATREVPAK